MFDAYNCFVAHRLIIPCTNLSCDCSGSNAPWTASAPACLSRSGTPASPHTLNPAPLILSASSNSVSVGWFREGWPGPYRCPVNPLAPTSLLSATCESPNRRTVVRIDSLCRWARWAAFQRPSWRAVGGPSAAPKSDRWGAVPLVVPLAVVPGKTPPEPRPVTLRS